MFHLNRGGGSNISKMKVGRYLGGVSLEFWNQSMQRLVWQIGAVGATWKALTLVKLRGRLERSRGAVKKGVSVRALSQGANKKYPTGPERGGQEIKLLNRAGPKI